MASQSAPAVRSRRFPTSKAFLALLAVCFIVWIFHGFLAFELLLLFLWLMIISEAIWNWYQGDVHPPLPLGVQIVLCSVIILFTHMLLAPGISLFLNVSVTELSGQVRQIGIAIHRYHEINDKLPPAAILSKDGKPLLSWRVAILPFLGHEEKQLYSQFKLDESWDSPHNLELLKRIPDVYTMPRYAPQPPPGETFFQLFVGPGAAFEIGKSRTLDELAAADGTGKIVIGAVVTNSVPWTKPQDIDFSPALPLPELERFVDNPFPLWRLIRPRMEFESAKYTWLLFADAHLAGWPRGRDIESLRPHITWNGGEKVEMPW